MRLIAIEPNEFKREFNYQMAPYIEWVRLGGESKETISFPFLKWFTARVDFPKLLKGKKAYLVFTGGGSVFQSTFPYYITSEVVPMIWDCWPVCYELVCNFLERKRVRTCIVTSSITAMRIHERFPQLNILFVPEAVSVDSYYRGELLVNRNIDILEYGRSNGILSKDSKWDEQIIHIFSKDGQPLFSSSIEFRKKLSDSKLTLAFPRCDTQPEIAGDVETLTQRYWENMLSRVVMVGRAPRELVELIGYNPVIDIDKKNPEKQMLDILNHIEDYQSFVDKNRETALEKGDWSSRMKQIRSFLRNNNYEV